MFCAWLPTWTYPIIPPKKIKSFSGFSFRRRVQQITETLSFSLWIGCAGIPCIVYLDGFPVSWHTWGSSLDGWRTGHPSGIEPSPASALPNTPSGIPDHRKEPLTETGLFLQFLNPVFFNHVNYYFLCAFVFIVRLLTRCFRTRPKRNCLSCSHGTTV